MSVVLYAAWLATLAFAFIIDVPVLALVAAVGATAQTVYAMSVARRTRASVRLSPRQLKVIIWVRVGLCVFWLSLVAVTLAIRLPVVAIFAVVMTALQAFHIVRLAKTRRETP